jgi:hypothetical protein
VIDPPCVRDLAPVLFPGVSSLVVDEVDDTGTFVRLRARATAPDGSGSTSTR